MKKLAVTMLLLACALPLTAGKKPRWALTRQPTQTVEIPGLAITPAAEKCENWAWGAIMEDMLRVRGLPLRQQDLVTKANGGEVCDDRLGDLEHLAHVVAGEYVRDDGTRVKVESRFTSGLSTSDEIIASVQRGQPLLLVWRRHFYLVRGVIFDLAIAQTGEKVYEVHEILLADPYLPGEKGHVSYVRERDDPAEVQGMIDVTVTPEPKVDWLHRDLK